MPEYWQASVADSDCPPTRLSLYYQKLAKAANSIPLAYTGLEVGLDGAGVAGRHRA